jgi:hypothetical protein
LNDSIKAEAKTDGKTPLYVLPRPCLLYSEFLCPCVSGALAIRPRGWGWAEGLQRGFAVTGVKLEEKPIIAVCRWVVLL